MGRIDDACRDVVASVDGAVACGVVDLDTGMLLGIHNAAGYTQTLNEIVAAATMDHDCDPQWTRQLDKKRKAPPGFTLVYLAPGETRRFLTEVATDVYRPVPTSAPKAPACVVGMVVASLFGPATQRGSLLAVGRYTVDVSLPFADAALRAGTKATATFDVK